MAPNVFLAVSIEELLLGVEKVGKLYLIYFYVCTTWGVSHVPRHAGYRSARLAGSNVKCSAELNNQQS